MDGQRPRRVFAGCLAFCVYAVLSFNLIMAAVDALTPLEYAYALADRRRWLVCAAALLAAALVSQFVAGQRGRRYLFVQLVAYPAVFALFFGWGHVDGVSYLLILLLLVLAAILFERAEAARWAKILMRFATVILAVPVAIGLFLNILFNDFGMTTERNYPSPDGLYYMELIIADEGAFGGSTDATVYSAGSDVPLPFGTLRRPLGKLGQDWYDPDTLEVRWEDADTIVVGDISWRWREDTNMTVIDGVVRHRREDGE